MVLIPTHYRFQNKLQYRITLPEQVAELDNPFHHHQTYWHSNIKKIKPTQASVKNKNKDSWLNITSEYIHTPDMFLDLAHPERIAPNAPMEFLRTMPMKSVLVEKRSETKDLYIICVQGLFLKESRLICVDVIQGAIGDYKTGPEQAKAN